MPASMTVSPSGTAATLGATLLALALAGCATRAAHVAPNATDPAEFAVWGCDRVDDEVDAVRQRAAEVAYDVDARLGNNVLALGIGATLFWPAMLAMQPDGPEAAELARLKGRDDALRAAARDKGCPPATPELPAVRAARLPVAIGDRLVYEQRRHRTGPTDDWVLQVAALRRDELEFRLPRGGDGAAWLQDPAGNVTQAPPGQLYWQHLLRRDLPLGQVLAGELAIGGDSLVRARVRGQVVAVGPQTLAGRAFDVAVIELYGDALRGDESTRLDGALVVDRASGVLLRLDLRCAMPEFRLMRRLARIERPER